MSTVLDEAQNIGGIVTAARRRERWEQQMAKTSDPEKREALREAIADLEARFPELEELPPGGAEGFARSRGHGTRARSPVRHGRQRLQPSRGEGAPRSSKKGGGLGGDSKAAKGSKPRAGLDPSARRSPSSRRRPRPTPRVDRAVRETGIPAAVDSSTSATMLALGATIALALLYLVVTSAEKRGTGAAAVPSVIESVTNGLGRFLSLADVFPSTPTPTPRAAAAAAANGGAVPTPAEARAEGRKLLPQVPKLPRPKGVKKVPPTHFNPSYVTGGGGR